MQNHKKKFNFRSVKYSAWYDYTNRNNNAFENEFWRTHNPYKLTPHIDSKPKYTPPYYAPQETGFGSFNYETYKKNLKRI